MLIVLHSWFQLYSDFFIASKKHQYFFVLLKWFNYASNMQKKRIFGIQKQILHLLQNRGSRVRILLPLPQGAWNVCFQALFSCFMVVLVPERQKNAAELRFCSVTIVAVETGVLRMLVTVFSVPTGSVWYSTKRASGASCASPPASRLSWCRGLFFGTI